MCFLQIGDITVTMKSVIMQDASQKAYDVLVSQGLTFPDRPEEEIPSLPSDITELSDEALMFGYTSLVAWTDFAASQAAAASVDERAAFAAADRAELQVLGSITTKGAVSLSKARAASDPDVVELKADAEYAHHYRKMVETVRDNLDRNYALFSRELTRRTSTDPRTRKDRYTT